MPVDTLICTVSHSTKSKNFNMKFLLFLLFSIIMISHGHCACTMDNWAYGGGNILVSGFHNIQMSWEACQQSCQAITNCKFWTWFKPDYEGDGQNFCELKFEDGGIPLPGVISGPRFC